MRTLHSKSISNSDVRTGPPDAIVLQSLDTWLPQTMTWLHVQTSELPPGIENHILCDAVANLDQFALRRIHAGTARPLGRILAKHSWWLYSKWRERHRSRVARLVRPDILHSHFGDRGWADLSLARSMTAAQLVTFYGYDVNRLPQVDVRWRTRYQDMFRSVALVLCEGPHLRRCVEALGCPSEKVSVHHLGVMVDKIAFMPTTWRPGETLRVLIAGTFVEKKGITYALEALARLQSRVDLAITIIGDEIDQDRSRTEKRKILATIDRSGLAQSVNRRGFRPYSELLAAAYDHHVFLSPSVTASDGDTEGGAPVTILEMAASGMQIVSSRHCDIPEIVIDGVTGLLAEERDIDGLYAALLDLITYPERWAERASAARRHIEAHFDAAKQSQLLAAIYRSVVKPGTMREARH